MRVEFTVPMEGPRCDEFPKGISRRPGQRDTLDDAEALRLISRNMAFEIGEDGLAIHPAPERVAPVEAPVEAAAEPASPPPPPPAPPSPRRHQVPTEKAVTAPGEKAVSA